MLPEVEKCGIKPDDIDLSDDLSNTFGQSEREQLASSLISFAQNRGDWKDFKRSEIREFLQDDYFFLDEAEQNEFLENNDDGTYSYTLRLIWAAFENHPKK